MSVLEKCPFPELGFTKFRSKKQKIGHTFPISTTDTKQHVIEVGLKYL